MNANHSKLSKQQRAWPSFPSTSRIEPSPVFAVEQVGSERLWSCARMMRLFPLWHFRASSLVSSGGGPGPFSS